MFILTVHKDFHGDIFFSTLNHTAIYNEKQYELLIMKTAQTSVQSFYCMLKTSQNHRSMKWTKVIIINNNKSDSTLWFFWLITGWFYLRNERNSNSHSKDQGIGVYYDPQGQHVRFTNQTGSWISIDFLLVKVNGEYLIFFHGCWSLCIMGKCAIQNLAESSWSSGYFAPTVL